jgi:hypothetical protein
MINERGGRDAAIDFLDRNVTQPIADGLGRLFGNGPRLATQ